MKKMMTDTILEINGLCKKYPGFLLDNVSFSLRRGRIMGLIGRNGAGKTTTLKSIFNLVHPDRGEIRIFGLTVPENERADDQIPFRDTFGDMTDEEIDYVIEAINSFI